MLRLLALLAIVSHGVAGKGFDSCPNLLEKQAAPKHPRFTSTTAVKCDDASCDPNEEQMVLNSFKSDAVHQTLCPLDNTTTCSGCAQYTGNECRLCSGGYRQTGNKCIRCWSVPSFVDRESNTCADYEKQNWCKDGAVTDQERANQKYKSLSAAQSCCVCGGGKTKATPFIYASSVALTNKPFKLLPQPQTAKRYRLDSTACTLNDLGLTFDPLTGQISGTPTKLGAASCVVSAFEDTAEDGTLVQNSTLKISVVKNAYSRGVGQPTTMLRFDNEDLSSAYTLVGEPTPASQFTLSCTPENIATIGTDGKISADVTKYNTLLGTAKESLLSKCEVHTGTVLSAKIMIAAFPPKAKTIEYTPTNVVDVTVGQPVVSSLKLTQPSGLYAVYAACEADNKALVQDVFTGEVYYDNLAVFTVDPKTGEVGGSAHKGLAKLSPKSSDSRTLLDIECTIFTAVQSATANSGVQKATTLTVTLKSNICWVPNIEYKVPPNFKMQAYNYTISVTDKKDFEKFKKAKDDASCRESCALKPDCAGYSFNKKSECYPLVLVPTDIGAQTKDAHDPDSTAQVKVPNCQVYNRCLHVSVEDGGIFSGSYCPVVSSKTTAVLPLYQRAGVGSSNFYLYSPLGKEENVPSECSKANWIIRAPTKKQDDILTANYLELNGQLIGCIDGPLNAGQEKMSSLVLFDSVPSNSSMFKDTMDNDSSTEHKFGVYANPRSCRSPLSQELPLENYDAANDHLKAKVTGEVKGGSEKKEKVFQFGSSHIPHSGFAHSLTDCECFSETWGDHDPVTAQAFLVASTQSKPRHFNNVRPGQIPLWTGPHTCEPKYFLGASTGATDCFASCKKLSGCKFFVESSSSCDLFSDCREMHRDMSATPAVFNAFAMSIEKYCVAANPEACWANVRRRHMLSDYQKPAVRCAFQDLLEQCDFEKLFGDTTVQTCYPCQYLPLEEALLVPGLEKKPLGDNIPHGYSISVGCADGYVVMKPTSSSSSRTELTCIDGDWLDSKGTLGLTNIACGQCVQVFDEPEKAAVRFSVMQEETMFLNYHTMSFFVTDGDVDKYLVAGEDSVSGGRRLLVQEDIDNGELSGNVHKKIHRTHHYHRPKALRLKGEGHQEERAVTEWSGGSQTFTDQDFSCPAYQAISGVKIQRDHQKWDMNISFQCSNVPGMTAKPKSETPKCKTIYDYQKDCIGGEGSYGGLAPDIEWNLPFEKGRGSLLTGFKSKWENNPEYKVTDALPYGSDYYWFDRTYTLVFTKLPKLKYTSECYTRTFATKHATQEYTCKANEFVAEVRSTYDYKSSSHSGAWMRNYIFTVCEVKTLPPSKTDASLSTDKELATPFDVNVELDGSVSLARQTWGKSANTSKLLALCDAPKLYQRIASAFKMELPSHKSNCTQAYSLLSVPAQFDGLDRKKYYKVKDCENLGFVTSMEGSYLDCTIHSYNKTDQRIFNEPAWLAARRLATWSTTQDNYNFIKCDENFAFTKVSNKNSGKEAHCHPVQGGLKKCAVTDVEGNAEKDKLTCPTWTVMTGIKYKAGKTIQVTCCEYIKFAGQTRVTNGKPILSAMNSRNGIYCPVVLDPFDRPKYEQSWSYSEGKVPTSPDKLEFDPHKGLWCLTGHGCLVDSDVVSPLDVTMVSYTHSNFSVIPLGPLVGLGLGKSQSASTAPAVGVSKPPVLKMVATEPDYNAGCLELEKETPDFATVKVQFPEGNPCNIMSSATWKSGTSISEMEDQGPGMTYKQLDQCSNNNIQRDYDEAKRAMEQDSTELAFGTAFDLAKLACSPLPVVDVGIWWGMGAGGSISTEKDSSKMCENIIEKIEMTQDIPFQISDIVNEWAYEKMGNDDCDPLQNGLMRVLCDMHCVKDAVTKGTESVNKNIADGVNLVGNHVDQLLAYYSKVITDKMDDLDLAKTKKQFLSVDEHVQRLRSMIQTHEDTDLAGLESMETLNDAYDEGSRVLAEVSSKIKTEEPEAATATLVSGLNTVADTLEFGHALAEHQSTVHKEQRPEDRSTGAKWVKSSLSSYLSGLQKTFSHHSVLLSMRTDLANALKQRGSSLLEGMSTLHTRTSATNMGIINMKLDSLLSGQSEQQAKEERLSLRADMEELAGLWEEMHGYMHEYAGVASHMLRKGNDAASDAAAYLECSSSDPSFIASHSVEINAAAKQSAKTLRRVVDAARSTLANHLRIMHSRDIVRRFVESEVMATQLPEDKASTHWLTPEGLAEARVYLTKQLDGLPLAFGRNAVNMHQQLKFLQDRTTNDGWMPVSDYDRKELVESLRTLGKLMAKGTAALRLREGVLQLLQHAVDQSFLQSAPAPTACKNLAFEQHSEPATASMVVLHDFSDASGDRLLVSQPPAAYLLNNSTQPFRSSLTAGSEDLPEEFESGVYMCSQSSRGEWSLQKAADLPANTELFVCAGSKCQGDEVLQVAQEGLGEGNLGDSVFLAFWDSPSTDPLY